MWKPVQKHWQEKKVPESQEKKGPEWQEKKSPAWNKKEESGRKAHDWQESNGAKTISTQDSFLATETLTRTLWVGPKGETYTISLRGGLKAAVVRREKTSRGHEDTKMYDLWFDKSYSFIWWGIKEAFFLDLADLLADPSQVSWYDGKDWNKRWNPRFVWSKSEDTVEASSEKEENEELVDEANVEVESSPDEPVKVVPVLAAPLPPGPLDAPAWEAPPGLAPPPGLENVVPMAVKLRRGRGDSSQDESDETRVGSERSDSDAGDSLGGGQQIAEFEPQHVFAEAKPAGLVEDVPRTKLRSRADLFVPLPFVPAAEVAAAWDNWQYRNHHYAGFGRCQY